MARNFSEKQKERIWNKYFTSRTNQTDVFGRRVSFNTAEFDHILPFDKGGKTVIQNGIPLAPKSNEEKSDKTSGTVNGKYFNVYYSNGIWVLYVNNRKVSKW